MIAVSNPTIFLNKSKLEKVDRKTKQIVSGYIQQQENQSNTIPQLVFLLF